MRLEEWESFQASIRGQFSCRCTLDQWLDLILFQVEKLNILSKSRYNVDLILVMYYISAGWEWPCGFGKNPRRQCNVFNVNKKYNNRVLSSKSSTCLSFRY